MSRVDLFRGPAGARLFLEWIDTEQQRNNTILKSLGGEALGRAPAGIGRGSWIYWGKSAPFLVLVVWRQAHVIGSINSWRITRDRALALARVQQRRVAAAVQ